MATRVRPVHRGATRARAIVAELGRELHEARVDRGISLAEQGRAADLSPSQISRIERDLIRNLAIPTIARLLAAVGLDIVARAYPAGEPIRDAGHARLLASLRGRLHRSLAWRTEVPLPIRGDLRAWDAVIGGPSWRAGVECETRPRDLQALERRLALKQRDGGMDFIILLLRDSAHNRELLRHAPGLLDRFPVRGSRALELLAAGVSPGGDAMIRL